MDNIRLQLESMLVDRLQGKLSILQTQEEKESIVTLGLDEILQDDSSQLKNKVISPNETYEKIEFIKDFLSYGIIEDLLCDSRVEDIIINALNPIHIHHSQKGLIATNKRFETRLELDLFVRKLILFSTKKKLQKIMNFELPNLEGRVNIVTSPFGPQITITKASAQPLSILDLIHRGSLNYEVAAQLWIYVEGLSIRPANMIIAGGPGVGKTTLLNALFSFIPTGEHIVVIEDTLELNTFLEDSCSRLESDDDLTLADLVKNSLRMRPERIIVGEVRGAEARDMMTAANVGKYCIGTIHALTSREAIIRLQNEPMNIPEDLVQLIDTFIVLKRYHVNEKIFRVVDEVSETSGMENVKVLLAQIYKYDYEQQHIKPISTSTVYRDRLAREAGVSAKDIICELMIRALVLKTLDDKNIHTMKEITAFCRAYSQNPNDTMASLGLDRKQLLSELNPR